jgi:excinuclease ABC subunit A
VVEHDEETMREADFLVDIGPGAGKHGGQIVGFGTPQMVAEMDSSPTGRFLAHKEEIEVPEKRREVDREALVKAIELESHEGGKTTSKAENTANGKFRGEVISILGATENNLKNVDIHIPLRKFVAITGVSGSGKSTLINEIFSNQLMNYFYDSHRTVGKFEEMIGINNIDKPIIIDQSPIGRTPRSNPATYTGLFTPIRELFASLPESKARGYTQGRFSFNVPGGRCETCQGDGIIRVEMNFLPDVYVVCEDCDGKRYNRETLEILYREKTISDILEMSVADAFEFFQNHKVINRKLETLKDVGLGYIRLGQQATTLSGGEAQRVKLATELSKVGTGNTLYILDEPTTGLHPLDVKLLLKVLHALVDRGNTVLVIEHNLDVIKTADWVVDLGPEGGNKGGEIVATGTPEEVALVKASYTGQYLRHTLGL